MLDQRLLRDTPELITQQLGRRGMTLDLGPLQQIARQERDLEEQRSDLQAEGNRIGKAVGQLIQGGTAPNSPEVQALRDQGNAIKQQVAALAARRCKAASRRRRCRCVGRRAASAGGHAGAGRREQQGHLVQPVVSGRIAPRSSPRLGG